MYDAAPKIQADMVCASTNGRNHPVVGLWPVALADELRYALEEEAVRKVDLWTGRYQLAVSAFDASRGDPFFNVNRPEDLERAEKWRKGFLYECAIVWNCGLQKLWKNDFGRVSCARNICARV